LNILFVTSYYKPAYTFGGPVVSTAAICENLIKHGVKVTVFTTNAGGDSVLDVPINRPKDIDGVEVWYFPLRFGGLGFFYASGLYSRIFHQIHHYDIIFTESLWGYASIPVYQASRHALKPYVVQLNGQLEPWSLQQKSTKKNIYLKLWGKKFLDNANGLLCTAITEVEHLEGLKLRSLPFIVPLGLNLDTYTESPAKELFRIQFNIPEEAPVMLFLGRLHHKKRPDLAIKVLSMLPEDLQNCHLILAGPDQENLISTLTIYAQKLDCLGRVHFTGMLERKQVLDAFAASNLLIMPSEPQSENFGMAAAEALAAGLPILVSDSVPVGYWAVEAGAGRTASCDAESLTQAAADMLSNPSQLIEMGKQGRELAHKIFDIQKVTSQIVNQFQAIIQTGRPVVDQFSDN
jgi:glycosyltransferase involved in cell wall biosynthesis